MSEPIKIQAAYAGVRLTIKNTLGHKWEPTGGDTSRDALLFTKQIVSHAAIGAIYEVTKADDGQWYIAGEHAPKRIVDEWAPDDARLAWEAAHTDARIEHEKIQIAKREKDTSMVRDVLLPLRVAMHRRPSISRYAMAQAVVAELHRPLTQAEKKEAGL